MSGLAADGTADCVVSKRSGGTVTKRENPVMNHVYEGVPVI